MSESTSTIRIVPKFAVNHENIVSLPFRKSDLLCQFCRFGILTEEQHVDHACDDRQRADESDHVEVSGEHAADLVDAQRDDIGKSALVTDGEP